MEKHQREAIDKISAAVHSVIADPELPHATKIELLDSLRIIKEMAGVVLETADPQ